MQTTLNLKDTDIYKIHQIAKKLHINGQETVYLLLAYFMKQKPVLEDFTRGVCYQDDDPNYKRFHIKFSQIEYECNMDLKKLFKLSLSFIVAISIALYSDELEHKYIQSQLGSRQNIFDNYKIHHYYYVSSVSEGERFLSFRWIQRRE